MGWTSWTTEAECYLNGVTRWSLLLFWQEGCLSDGQHLEEKIQLWEGRWVAHEGNRSAVPTWAPPMHQTAILEAHTFHGHLNDRLETVQHRDSNSLCTKCKCATPLKWKGAKIQAESTHQGMEDPVNWQMSSAAAFLQRTGAAPSWLVCASTFLRPFSCFQAPELPWVVFVVTIVRYFNIQLL